MLSTWHVYVVPSIVPTILGLLAVSASQVAGVCDRLAQIRGDRHLIMACHVINGLMADTYRFSSVL